MGIGAMVALPGILESMIKGCWHLVIILGDDVQTQASGYSRLPINEMIGRKEKLNLIHLPVFDIGGRVGYNAICYTHFPRVEDENEILSAFFSTLIIHHVDKFLILIKPNNEYHKV